MEIMIDEKYALRSDSNCWTVCELRGVDKDNKKVWLNRGYYQHPGNAIKCIANYEIRMSEAKNFIEAIKRVNEIEAKYNKILEALK